MYYRPDDEHCEHSFTENIRLKVTHLILESPKKLGGKINIFQFLMSNFSII